MRGLTALAIVAFTLALTPVAVAAEDEPGTLTDERLWYTRSFGQTGPDGEQLDFSGIVSGSFDCQAGVLYASVEGNAAHGPYAGPYTADIYAEFSGGLLTAFELDFGIASADTLVYGTASYIDAGADVTCGVRHIEDEGDLHQLAIGSGGGANQEPLLLSFEATIAGPDATSREVGALSAAINLGCWGSTADLNACEVVTILSTFASSFVAPEPPPPPQTMIVSNSMGSSIGSFEGMTSGSFTCGTPSTLQMDVAGSAYGPYAGTFTETVSVALQDGLVQAYDATFQILAGDTTVAGEAHYVGGTSDGRCASSFDEDYGQVYRFSAGAGGGGHAPLLVRYTATVQSPAGTHVEEGWASAGVMLFCFGSSVFTSNCDVATSVLSWLEPEVIGTDGQAATAPATSDQPVALSVDNPAGGTVEITPLPTTPTSGSSFAVLGTAYDVHAENTATVEAPIRLTFTLHSSLLLDQATGDPIDPATVTLLRDGSPVADCSSSTLVAEPDPCVRSRSVDAAGDLTLEVLTSHASVWVPVVLLATPDAATIIAAVEALPAGAFKAPGHQDAMADRLAAVQDTLDAGDLDAAVGQLHNLRRHVDGCGVRADRDDWLVDCVAQLEVRELTDGLIAHLQDG